MGGSVTAEDLLRRFRARGVSFRTTPKSGVQIRATTALISADERAALRGVNGELFRLLSRAGEGALAGANPGPVSSRPVPEEEWDRYADELETTLLQVRLGIRRRNSTPSQKQSARRLMCDARDMLREAIRRDDRAAAGRAVAYAEHLARGIPGYLDAVARRVRAWATGQRVAGDGEAVTRACTGPTGVRGPRG
jgi:hypothetical protein